MTHFVHIPLRRTDEVLQIPVTSLPSNCQDIIRILKNEEAPVDVWVHTAVGYYNIGEPEQFSEILRTALDSTSSHNKDRKKIYDAIAAYNAERAYQTNDKAQRKQFAERATNAISSSENIHYSSMSLLKGIFCLYTDNNYEEANKNFQNFLDDSSIKGDNTVALIARGISLYHLKKYDQALDAFREAVKNNPVCINEVRVGFGLCYFQLGREKLATRWFDRALEVNPDNVEALLGLAIIEFNKPNLRERKKEGYKYIRRAYKINPEHPRVLNYLARYYFHTGDLEKAGTLSMMSQQRSRSRLIKAESQYIQGRIHQVRREFGMAIGKFQAVLSVWPDHVLARHGFAQMHLSQKHTTESIQQLRSLLGSNHHNGEVLKLLGSLEGKEGNHTEAIKHLEASLLQTSHDWEAWLELAQLKEKKQPYGALHAYEKAVEAQTKNIATSQDCSLAEAENQVPAELWNNLGALRHREGKYEIAEIAYLNAIAVSGHKIQDLHVENITTTYNIARLYEDMFRTSDAQLLYSRILKESPNLTECYIRLAMMAADSNRMDTATEWIRCAFVYDYDNIDLWTLSGNLFFKQRDWQKAQQKFEHILEIAPQDIYAMLSLANIYYYASRDTKINKEKAAKFVKHASHFYRQVLAMQPNNLSAICGLGCVLATVGHIEEARICFTQVRENATNKILKINSYRNLAHLMVKEERFSNAIQLYTKCLQQAKEDSNEYQLYLAHCHFRSVNLLESKALLLKAIHVKPLESTLWYDLAITQAKYGGIVSKKKKNATLNETRTAISEVSQALKLFTKLIEKAKDPSFSRKYSSALCQEEKKYCENLLKNLNSLLVKLEEVDTKNRKMLEENQRIADESFAKARREKEEQKRLKRERAERIAAETRKIELEDQEKFRLIAERDKKRNRKDSDLIDDDPPTKKQKTKKKQKQQLSDQEDSDSDLEPNAPMPSIDYDESIEEMRARRGGVLNQLAESVDNERRARKQKDIEEIRSINADIEPIDPEPMDTTDDSSDEGIIQRHLEEIISNLTRDEGKAFTTKKMRNALVAAGVSNSLFKANRKFAKDTAVSLLKQKQKEK